MAPRFLEALSLGWWVMTASAALCRFRTLGYGEPSLLHVCFCVPVGWLVGCVSAL